MFLSSYLMYGMDTAMGYDGYAISENHIYISFEGMRET